MALVIAVARPSSAFLGQDGHPPRHRIFVTDQLAAQWNPLGIQNDIFLGYRYRLVQSHKLLFRDTFAGVMGIARINPAFARLGAGVELQPMAVLTLRALWEQRLYFGNFNLLQSWRSPYDEHDESTIKAGGERGLNYRGNGHQVTLQAVLRAKMGPLVLLNDFSLYYFYMYLRQGDQVFYESLLDTAAPGKGFVICNSAHLLFLTDFRFIFGLRYTVVHAFYPDGALDTPRGSGNPNTPNQRLGPLLAYVFPSKSRYFQQPMLALIVNWWISNRYRAGQKVSQAVPYGALALQFQGDLWTK